MGNVFTLRNLPTSSLQMAQRMCGCTEQSMNDVLRQAIVSGLLVEASRLAPEQDGTLSGVKPAELARALRRHLGSAIDVLLEHHEHPYQTFFLAASVAVPSSTQQPQPSAPDTSVFKGAIGDDLDLLGIGTDLSEYAEESSLH